MSTDRGSRYGSHLDNRRDPHVRRRLAGEGFFAALFDFSFTSFITLRFLKVIYGVLVVLILLSGVVFLISGLSRGGSAALLSLVGVPVVTLLYLVLARIYMELIALFFRIGENTSLMARAAGGGAPEPTGGYGGEVYPTPPTRPAAPTTPARPSTPAAGERGASDGSAAAATAVSCQTTMRTRDSGTALVVAASYGHDSSACRA